MAVACAVSDWLRRSKASLNQAEIQLLALGLQRREVGHHEVWRFQPQHQRAMVLAAVVAGRKVGNSGRAVEVDREVEIAFAAWRGAGNFLNRLHAVGQQLGLQKTVLVQVDIHAGVAQVAIGGDQLGQQRHLLRVARLPNSKANAARAGVDGGQQLRDVLQIGQRRINPADIDELAKRVAHNANRLYPVALSLDGIGNRITLLLGLAQTCLPLRTLGGHVDEGGDGTHAHQRVKADLHSSIRSL